jgi:hypothetical protein
MSAAASYIVDLAARGESCVGAGLLTCESNRDIVDQIEH